MSKKESIEVVGTRVPIGATPSPQKGTLNAALDDGSATILSHDLRKLLKDEVSGFEILKKCTHCDFSCNAPSMCFNILNDQSSKHEKSQNECENVMDERISGKAMMLCSRKLEYCFRCSGLTIHNHYSKRGIHSQRLNLGGFSPVTLSNIIKTCKSTKKSSDCQSVMLSDRPRTSPAIFVARSLENEPDLHENIQAKLSVGSASAKIAMMSTSPAQSSGSHWQGAMSSLSPNSNYCEDASEGHLTSRKRTIEDIYKSAFQHKSFKFLYQACSPVSEDEQESDNAYTSHAAQFPSRTDEPGNERFYVNAPTFSSTIDERSCTSKASESLHSSRADALEDQVFSDNIQQDNIDMTDSTLRKLSDKGCVDKRQSVGGLLCSLGSQEGDTRNPDLCTKFSHLEKKIDNDTQNGTFSKEVTIKEEVMETGHQNVVLNNDATLQANSAANLFNPKLLCDKTLSNWTNQNVVEFLEKTDCREFAAIFEKEDIDGKALNLLDEEKINKLLGIKIGPAMRIVSLINILKQSIKP